MKELRDLIRRMAAENRVWGQERIANELLLKLGLRVSPRTVAKYMPRRVLESLFAYWQARRPAVPVARILQVIRNLEEEVRAYAADTVQRFVNDSSRDREHGPPPAAEDLFRKAAAPFLKEVWPLERSLVTPGVSRAFAELPAASGNAFAEAVAAVERFLIPFDCWSMLDYGFFEDGGSRPKLSSIDTQAKAQAFIDLLDSTVGSTTGAVVPHDLSDALEQVRRVAPALADLPAYRRLATAARRVG